MKLQTEREQIKRAIKTKMRQLPEDSERRGALECLDPDTATAEDIRLALGYREHVTPRRCDDCGTEGWQMVQLGGDAWAGHASCNTCRPCLVRALALLDGATP